jgi:hypothetical protein
MRATGGVPVTRMHSRNGVPITSAEHIAKLGSPGPTQRSLCVSVVAPVGEGLLVKAARLLFFTQGYELSVGL